MPWCSSCDKFFNPASVDELGSCPSCGRIVDIGELAMEDTSNEVKVPWHFWVGVVAVVVYLGWRLIQGVWLLF
ncbi:MAG: hypothetical protein CL470_03365 [Acidimicrobiaceae bacterium]|nr:hypothetical protein [Acidimicrobiaceae bacterium]|tara:strand:- start:73 stop:291 length:219 start_codon:yes stop_codon:yes gene_type:complete